MVGRLVGWCTEKKNGPHPRTGSLYSLCRSENYSIAGIWWRWLKPVVLSVHCVWCVCVSVCLWQCRRWTDMRTNFQRTHNSASIDFVDATYAIVLVCITVDECEWNKSIATDAAINGCCLTRTRSMFIFIHTNVGKKLIDRTHAPFRSYGIGKASQPRQMTRSAWIVTRDFVYKIVQPTHMYRHTHVHLQTARYGCGTNEFCLSIGQDW